MESVQFVFIFVRCVRGNIFICDLTEDVSERGIRR